MDYKEKIEREKKLLEHWDILKKERDNLSNILTRDKEPTSLDTILLFQCLAVILEKIDLCEDEISQYPEDLDIEDDCGIMDMPIFDSVKNIESYFTLDIKKEIVCLMVIFDDAKSMNDRFDAIEQMK